MIKKIKRIKIFLLSPIPKDQKPIKEFIFLKKNLMLLLVFQEFLIIRLKEIEKKLKTPNIVYEEASWYDGQVWKKPFSFIKTDRLITTQKIKPILKQYFYPFFLAFSYFFIFVFVLCFI